MERPGTSVPWETLLIDALGDFGIAAQRRDGLPGSWVDNEKIAFIGVRIGRGITTHGFALNVNPDLSYFRHIVPCGMEDMVVTSMERVLGRPIALEDVTDSLAPPLQPAVQQGRGGDWAGAASGIGAPGPAQPLPRGLLVIVVIVIVVVA